ncbi:lipopolysaccharide/colanic/teichoic acid biosynthesis glycosyltransferase [Pelomonas saccharophila]|uniref:Lipopolysaccharide/colanic/teichoic acid biosynthesis glycosyltransferase n=1 Tax=Roseateles saccharophilus TaxID=304 RepID=A0ABU1YT32_ROSSA|nr:sugar transferase [Roseateles saccharophilus]MDR7271888.1 lipopolysaccharide/colanic/teichoic acid biosynthesis glycosyltransferase [Roseateles saccharophilus]
MIKRLFDMVCSALGLLALAPLLLLAAVWIKLDSPGPALFRQTRVGRFGAPFTIHKFRTMRVEPGAAITVGADPRITRPGHFLRRTKLDELPQLWDVLRGAMSLVGPRPELPHYVDLYPADLRQRVLAVRPGITDPASLAFSHEAELLAAAADPEREYREVVLPAKLRLSAEYAAGARFSTDLKLILATLMRVLRD